MESSPLVSFVIPSYNYGKYLKECIDSALNQEGGYDVEVVVVDDASSDNSAQIIRDYSDSRVRKYFHNENQGHVITINEGFSYAKGKYIARIDSDDRYRPYFLIKALRIFDKFSDVGVVYGDIASIDKYGMLTSERCHVRDLDEDYHGNDFIALLKKNFLPAPTIIAKAELWRAVLPIPDSVSFSDWYLNLQMARKENFYYINEVLADYRLHGMNHHVSNAKNMEEEKTVFDLLEKVFSVEEENPELQTQKEKYKKRIYAARYLEYANKYFGFYNDAEARRCYIKYFIHNPFGLFDFKTAVHFFGALIKRKNYEVIKKSFLSIIRKSHA